MKERKHKSDLELICKQCETIFYTAKREYTRRQKIGKKVSFCTNSCSTKFNNRKKFIIFKHEMIKNCKLCDKKFNLKCGKETIYCSKKCANIDIAKYRIEKSDEEKEIISKKISLGVKKWIKDNPEKNSELRIKQQETIDKNGNRYSSKAERALREELFKIGFKAHKFVYSGKEVNFDVDICKIIDDKQIWIESDGPYHFRKVHIKHNFEKSQLRDKVQEEYVNNSEGILLIRVSNEKYSIQEQLEFINKAINDWDGDSKVIKYY